MAISEIQRRLDRSFHAGILTRVVFSSLLVVVALTSPLNGQLAPQDPNRSDQLSPATQPAVSDPAVEAADKEAADKKKAADMDLTADGRERLAIVCTILLLVLIYTTIYAFLRDTVDKKRRVARFFLPWIVLAGLGALIFLAWWLTTPLELSAAQAGAAKTATVKESATGVASAPAASPFAGRFRPRKRWFEDITGPELTLIIISTFGPLGGVLFTMLDGKLTLPCYDPVKKEISLGYLVDCAYGWGGAFAVFLVLPGDLHLSEDLMQIIGTAFVAGYGGRAIIAQALGQLTDRINEVEGTFDKEDKALTLSREQLEGKEADPEVLSLAIQDSSPICRSTIFKEVEQVLEKYSAVAPDRVRLAVPILKGLVSSDQEDKQHRYHADLGIALMKGEKAFGEALKSFTDAIRIRQKVEADPNGDYEFYRAVCRIQLLPDRDEGGLTVQDLTAAAKDPVVRNVYQDEKGVKGSDAHAVSVWLAKQKGITAKSVGLEE